MKNKLITILFILYIAIFMILGILIKDKEISLAERRKLHTFPEVTISSEYVNKLDKYLLDHFPFRDTFRSIKANFNYHVLKKLDNNDIYIKDNYIFKSVYPTNKKSISNFVDKINTTKKMFTQDNNLYVMIIPDKNYYLDSKDFLSIDYAYLYQEVDKLNMSTIDIRNTMQLTDYYETDTHWRQERIEKVVRKMSTVMNFDYQKKEYEWNTYNHFYGVYYGESAINRKPEGLMYANNQNLSNLHVNYLENPSLHTVYNIDKLTSLDSYEVYLDGASSFIEIYNPNCYRDKELVIFRDSFASSITPLLADYYKKITLIDNRYIDSAHYLDYLNFTNQDILFMYSTLVVNNSATLKG